MVRSQLKIKCQWALLFLSFQFLNAGTKTVTGIYPENGKALENLLSAEASMLVYGAYDNFISSQNCVNGTHRVTENGALKKASYCKIKAALDKTETLFTKKDRKQDPLQILWKVRPVSKLYYAPKDNAPLGMQPAAPSYYKLTHVGCYKRPEIRHIRGTDCSLFFALYQGINESWILPPIFAVKGSSHGEDWRNNIQAGAPVLTEISSLFMGLKNILIGENIQSPDSGDMGELSGSITAFFDILSKASKRIIITGHSLGGALAQELARQSFLLSRKGEVKPVIRAITFNSLSYTTMIGKLSKNLSDVIRLKILPENKKDKALFESYRAMFDGIQLSAVNFHTADDILTRLFNDSFLGKIWRLRSSKEKTQAGDDILLATDRSLHLPATGDVMALSDTVKGHSMSNVLYDMAFSVGIKVDARGKKLENWGFSHDESRKNRIYALDQKSKTLKADLDYLSSPQFIRDEAMNGNDLRDDPRDPSKNMFATFSYSKRVGALQRRLPYFEYKFDYCLNWYTDTYYGYIWDFQRERLANTELYFKAN